MKLNKYLTLIITLLILYFILVPKYYQPRVVKGMLTDDECEYIKNKAEPKLKPSTISNSKILDPRIRKSETAWIRGEAIDTIISKCIREVNGDIERCEDLQVLRYKPGGFYRPHQDAFPSDNKRTHTIMIALNDHTEFSGGETVFPNIKKTYSLKKGDALVFNTLNNYGWIDDRGLHGGAPITDGEKWLANIWVHERPYY